MALALSPTRRSLERRHRATSQRRLSRRISRRIDSTWRSVNHDLRAYFPILYPCLQHAATSLTRGIVSDTWSTIYLMRDVRPPMSLLVPMVTRLVYVIYTGLAIVASEAALRIFDKKVFVLNKLLSQKKKKRILTPATTRGCSVRVMRCASSPSNSAIIWTMAGCFVWTPARSRAP